MQGEENLCETCGLAEWKHRVFLYNFVITKWCMAGKTGLVTNYREKKKIIIIK